MYLHTHTHCSKTGAHDVKAVQKYAESKLSRTVTVSTHTLAVVSSRLASYSSASSVFKKHIDGASFRGSMFKKKKKGAFIVSSLYHQCSA